MGLQPICNCCARATRHAHAHAGHASAPRVGGRRVRRAYPRPPRTRRHVHKKVLAAAKAFALNVDGRMGAECLINRVFKNNNSVLGHFLNKSIKVVEEDDTGDVCVFSDAYHVHETWLDEIVERCTAAGTPVAAFVHEYPGLEFSQSHRSRHTTCKMISFGHTQTPTKRPLPATAQTPTDSRTTPQSRAGCTAHRARRHCQSCRAPTAAGRGSGRGA